MPGISHPGDVPCQEIYRKHDVAGPLDRCRTCPAFGVFFAIGTIFTRHFGRQCELPDSLSKKLAKVETIIFFCPLHLR